jgi:hypothetical protein
MHGYTAKDLTAPLRIGPDPILRKMLLKPCEIDKEGSQTNLSRGILYVKSMGRNTRSPKRDSAKKWPMLRQSCISMQLNTTTLFLLGDKHFRKISKGFRGFF